MEIGKKHIWAFVIMLGTFHRTGVSAHTCKNTKKNQELLHITKFYFVTLLTCNALVSQSVGEMPKGYVEACPACSHVDISLLISGSTPWYRPKLLVRSGLLTYV